MGVIEFRTSFIPHVRSNHHLDFRTSSTKGTKWTGAFCSIASLSCAPPQKNNKIRTISDKRLLEQTVTGSVRCKMHELNLKGTHHQSSGFVFVSGGRRLASNFDSRTEVSGPGGLTLVIPWVVTQEVDGLKKSPGGLTLVIPWVVTQEVDGLKKDPSVGTQAQVSARFLSGYINKNISPVNVIGQSRLSVKNLERRWWVYRRNNDDRIIDLCVDMSEGGLNIILYSEDNGITAKAIIEGLKCARRLSLWPGPSGQAPRLQSRPRYTTGTATIEAGRSGPSGQAPRLPSRPRYKTGTSTIEAVALALVARLHASHPDPGIKRALPPSRRSLWP
ncbi:hypothetical protein JTE90_017043 [Oedothorax gibbosus]|uniref:PIN domain-containing protein n=1 Tax=Oedothorax gibbosus TaxID=931172 RepID=A0AAV6UMR8_9ARAC|nr:hypothetical protein JTE90_017043 [Oedothorax gibbosus]